MSRLLCKNHHDALTYTPEKQLKQTTNVHKWAQTERDDACTKLSWCTNDPTTSLLSNNTYKLPLTYYHRHGSSTICSVINSVKAHVTGTRRRMPQGMPLGTASPIRSLCPCVSPPTQTLTVTWQHYRLPQCRQDMAIFGSSWDGSAPCDNTKQGQGQAN